jgi:hypothetical protein
MKIKKKPGATSAKKNTVVQKQIQFQVNLLVSNGNTYRSETLEEFTDAFRVFAKERWPTANFTPTGGYYLIDGKVCRPEDFDRETMDRKPGTHPPSWSVQGDERKASILAERNEEQKKNTNALSRQPENLLTSRELDMVKKSEPAPAAPKKKVSLKKVEPVQAPKKFRVKRGTK